VRQVNTEFEVREARRSEAGLLHDLLVRAFSEYEGRLDPPSGANAETINSIAHKLEEGGALVCEGGGVTAGCIFYRRKDGHLHVGRLAVVPALRRRGIGDLLLRAAEGRAAELGLPSVRLGVRLALESLRAYYATRGYAAIALHSHAGHSQPTFVEMEKRLPGLASSDGDDALRTRVSPGRAER